MVRATIPVADIPSFLGHPFEAVARALPEQGLRPVGPPYDTMVETYNAMGEWITGQRLVPREGMWETAAQVPA